MDISAEEQSRGSVDGPVKVDDVKGFSGAGVCDSQNGGTGEKEAVIRNETAAVEVQRLYRGYRARRTVADAATMAHKFGWWNVVDGAMLQYNSSQFYAYNTPQNAAQRWLRLSKKAAKVGKGLSKNEKARKLALQHWLEAIDPRHRYGHNLHFYYEEWDKCQTHEPFFYWLDVGEGKDVDLEKCSRPKLQKELIRYLGPKERKAFEVIIQDGKLLKKLTGEPVNTPKGDKWIFVMSTAGKLYIGKKEKGKLQHSSFLAGGATTAAGRLLVNHGTIELMEAHSGHYHPTPENFQQLISILTSSGADLTMAKVQVVSDDMLSINSNSNSIRLIGASEASEETTLPDVSGISGDVQNGEGNNEDVCIRQVVSLTMDDEQNVSSVDKVTLVEDAICQEARDNSDVEAEGLELLRMKSKFDVADLSGNLEGMRVEVIKPRATLESFDDQMPVQEEGYSPMVVDSTSKVSLTTLPSQHKLFAPAMQALSKLEGRSGMCVPDLDDAKSENGVHLTPNAKALLLRRLSFNRALAAS